MKKDRRQLKLHDGLILCAVIFSLIFFTVADVKAADRSADYPSKAIEWVTHSKAGSSGDVLGRIVSDILQKEKILNQPLVVVNKVGSGGAVSFGYVLERKGNPYVVLCVSGTFLTTPIVENLPYDYKSFTPICNLILDGSVLAVRADSPFKTIHDIIAEAKKRPKKLNQGGSSFTGNDSMMGRTIQKVKGVQWNFISFAGGGREAVLNVLGGNVDFAFVNPDQALDHVRAGKMRVILTGAPKRYAVFKDAPTMLEEGVGDPIPAYRGVVGPPDMPDYAVEKLIAAFKKVYDNARFQKYCEDNVVQPYWVTRDDHRKLMEKESNNWRETLDELGMLKKK